MNTICTWPSLVDHRDVPSLVGHGGGRYAHKFIGENASALDIDWSKPSVTMAQTKTSAGRSVNKGPSIVAGTSLDMTSVEGRTRARQLRVARRLPNGRLDQPPVRPNS
jgi:hypothetical protein